MAVKKHVLMVNKDYQLDLETLSRYIKLLNDQPNYLPPEPELVKDCQDIVKCLSSSPGNEEGRCEILKTIEEFLLRIVNSVDEQARSAIVQAVMEMFYSYISDPKSEATAATSIVLVVIDTSSVESLMSTARWVIEQGENGPADTGLRSSLSCLYSWICEKEWEGTPVLGEWIMSLIKALEETERFDILIDVSVDSLVPLFSALDKPSTLRQSNADVIFHVLASLRHSLEAFDKISEHVDRVLTNLASDSGQFSRQLLQNVVDILTAAIEHFTEDSAQKVDFTNKYSEVILCLERHMVSGRSEMVEKTCWPKRNKVELREPTTNHTPPQVNHKVGLRNCGNNCYVNSIMQAMLVTRRFSTHVMMRMSGHPYWEVVAMLFAKMVYSVDLVLDVPDFYYLMIPPYFSINHQHDSSEFLGYFFELLQSFEYTSVEQYNYCKPPVLSSPTRGITYTVDDEASASGSTRRSVSPRPSSSGYSSGNKRVGSSDVNNLQPKKRLRTNEPVVVRKESFIDSVFGGFIITRYKCLTCYTVSKSRDSFRELQLSFPEKYDGYPYTVQNLLDLYCSTEKLTGDNQYRCHNCRKLRDAERSITMDVVPGHLILVLKTFKFEPKKKKQSKLIRKVKYDTVINMPVVVPATSPIYYELYAAVVHSGQSLHSGHFYTIAEDNGVWYKYSDEVVTVFNEHQVNELNKYETPYVLFYRRMDVVKDTVPALEDLPAKLQEHVIAHNKYFLDSLRP